MIFLYFSVKMLEEKLCINLVVHVPTEQQFLLLRGKGSLLSFCAQPCPSGHSTFLEVPSLFFPHTLAWASLLASLLLPLSFLVPFGLFSTLLLSILELRLTPGNDAFILWSSPLVAFQERWCNRWSETLRSSWKLQPRSLLEGSVCSQCPVPGHRELLCQEESPR